MSRFILSLVFAGMASAALALPPDGTQSSYRWEGDVYTVQLWTDEGFMGVTRHVKEVHKGDFTLNLAVKLAQAFMKEHQMTFCRPTGGGRYSNVLPGMYNVFYAC